MSAWRHWLVALALVALPASAAHAQRGGGRAQASRGRRRARPTAPARSATPPRVALHVNPVAGSLRWSFTLENTSDEPLETVADRHLLWLELPAAPPPAAPARRRRVRRRRAPAGSPVCVAPGAPRSNESAHRVSIPARGSYTEGVDLRELCGLRLPSQLAPGARVTVHYGFRGAPAFERAVVLDGSDPPVTELTPVENVEVPATTEPWPPQGPPAPRGDPRMAVTARGTFDAANLNGLTVNVRVTLASPYPLRTFFRPGQFRFAFTGPQGRAISCRGGFRDYAPIPDFFVRLTHGRGFSESVQLGLVCPPEAFTRPGIYRGQAIYESHAAGEHWGFHAFTGASGSEYFYVRITRGQQGTSYRTQVLTDPFSPPPAPAPAPAPARAPSPAQGASGAAGDAGSGPASGSTVAPGETETGDEGEGAP